VLIDILLYANRDTDLFGSIGNITVSGLSLASILENCGGDLSITAGSLELLVSVLFLALFLYVSGAAFFALRGELKI
jgi:hypothetical protein